MKGSEFIDLTEQQLAFKGLRSATELTM